ncbi:response regulator [Leptodesmis sp.]|uniref:response regulator n=1 Tax=Leptodesmis sp. TaxID=3100501 RepID=UPI003D0ED909
MYRIAVVDDNETWCFVIQRFLQEKNFTVSTFNNAHEFLAESQKFDLALIDFSIPARRHQRSMDGAEVIAQVRRMLRQPPILLLISAYFPEECLQETGQICSEADACLSKNLTLQQILAVIEHLLQQEQDRGVTETTRYSASGFIK